jgi:hypothetical protein
MSLIPDRYRCSGCDGYDGPGMAHLKGACTCAKPSLDDLVVEQREAREHCADPDDPESRAHLND